MDRYVDEGAGIFLRPMTHGATARPSGGISSTRSPLPEKGMRTGSEP